MSGQPDLLDRAEQEALVTAHLGLARQLARRFQHRGEPLDDLVQVAWGAALLLMVVVLVLSVGSRLVAARLRRERR